MLCPVCRFDNYEGEDSCSNCGADLATSGVPEDTLLAHDPILGDQLDALGLREPLIVEPATSVSAAIRRMHDVGTDCLLVCDGGRLMGIFTDRDAVVKVAGTQLAAFDVRDFMTPDPVVLRPDDTLAVAIHKMAVGEFRHIPVVDAGDRPIAVLSVADVFRHIVAALG